MRYFNFEIDNQKCGYYEQSDDGAEFYCNAVMVMNGDAFENPFWIRYEDRRVTAYRFEDGDYIPFDQPEGVYPTSAFSLLLRLMGDRDELTYTAFHEGRGEIAGEVTLRRNGDRIEEFAGDEPARYAVMNGDEVIEYGWGGAARSVRVNSLEEAKAGTVFEGGSDERLAMSD